LAIESYRSIGGIGAGLTVVGAVGSVLSVFEFATPSSSSASLALLVASGIIGVITFVGFVLFLVGMYGLSREYREHNILNYIIYGIVATVIAAVVAFALLLAFTLANFGIASSVSPTQSNILSFLAPAIPVLGFIGLINVVFNVLAFNLLSKKSGVSLFVSGARILLLGAIISVVIGFVVAAFSADLVTTIDSISVAVVPGALVQYVGWALLAVAFFRIQPPQQAYTAYTATPPDVPLQMQVKVCGNCGAQNLPDSVYCARCGQKLP
jgi:uncharacterized membrane protein